MGEYLNALWTQWGHSLLAAIPKIIQALIIALIVLWLGGRLQGGTERLVGRRGQRELGRLLGRLIRIGALLLGLVLILGIFQQTSIVASFIASLGIAGLMIAFALQDITKNFAAGILLLIQRPFGLDDRIRVKEYDGFVTDISLRATALRTADGHEVLIPNADVFSGPITNLTRYPARRITVALSIPHDIDPTVALPALAAVLPSDPAIKDHPPAVTVTGLTKDDMTAEASFWVPATLDAAALTSVVAIRLQQTMRGLPRSTQQNGAAAPAVAMTGDHSYTTPKP